MMPSIGCRWLCLALRLMALGIIIAFLGQTALPAQAEPPSKRFLARLADGTFVAGNYLTPWKRVEERLSLDDQALSDPGNPWRWLIDRSVSEVPPPRSFVQLANGDCLPGRVVRYVGPTNDQGRTTPAHFVVEPSVAIGEPGSPSPQTVRVIARYVQRIAWDRRAIDRREPATLFLRRGQPIRFQSARVDGAEVHLLVDTGIRDIPLSTVAELHPPAHDAWQLFFREQHALDQSCAESWWQIEMTTHLRLTGIVSQTQLLLAANKDRSVRWVPGIQTAWCLERLWAVDGYPRVRRAWRPDRVPLGRFVTEQHRKPLLLPSRASPFRSDRNVHGGPLQSGAHDYGWGIGVHAPSDLILLLHPCVTGMETGVGLDALAGIGGCARGRVLLEATGSQPQTCYESPVLVGSAQVVQSGRVAIPMPVDNKRRTPSEPKLILQADPVSHDPPQGADPLDIRDFVDWLDPVLHLDRSALERALETLEP